MVIHRFDVYLTRLDAGVRVEMRKTRPCLVISPELMHRFVGTVIIAPLTSAQTTFPTRVRCHFAGKTGEVALDHLHAVDRSRLLKRLGRFDEQTSEDVIAPLLKLFR